MKTGTFAQAGQTAPKLMVINQFDPAIPAGTSVDLAPFVIDSIRETGKFEPILYRPTEKLFKDALAAGRLTSSDLSDQPDLDGSRRLAKSIGAFYVLRLTGEKTRDAIRARVDVDYLVGQSTWNNILSDRNVVAPTEGARKPSILESIHLTADAIKERVAKVTVLTGSGNSSKMAVDGTPVTAKSDKLISPDPLKAISKPDPVKPTADPPKVSPKVPELSTYEIMIERARRNGDTANLIVSLKRAVTERPRDIRLRKDLITAYRDRGWSEVARQEAMRALTIVPNDSSLHRMVGDGYAANNDFDNAVKYYLLAIKLDAKDPLNHIALADVYAKGGRSVEAVAEYTIATNAEPKLPIAFKKLALAELQRSDFKACTAAMKSAVNYTPVETRVSMEEDYAEILRMIESLLTDIYNKVLTTKSAFSIGNTTRETAFKEMTSLRKKSDDLTLALDDLPSPTTAMGKIKALYSQGAALLTQSADKLLEGIEVASTSGEEEALLMRREAMKQISDASKKLKALLSKAK